MHLLFAGFLLVLQTFNSLATMQLDRIVAVIENNIIMQSELDEKLRTVASQMQQQGTGLPPPKTLEAQVLERMIMMRIQLEKAEETGIHVDDETLNKATNGIASENNVSLNKFREILEKDGFSYEKFRENIRNEIIISRLRQRQVDNRVSITSKEIDNALANMEFQGYTETEYQLNHILIPLPENPTPSEEEDAQLAAEKVLEALKTGQDFTTTAETISDNKKTLETNDLGWRKKNDIPTLFRTKVSSMEKGDISDLIKSASGFHIIKLTDTQSNEKHMITQISARHILIKADELTTEEIALGKLEQLKIRLDGGDDFSKLARSHSDDMISAADGGNLGWSSPGRLVPKFEEVMNQLKIGEISQPFETQFGWHILQVLDRREHDNTENSRREKIVEMIRRKKSTEAYQTWLRHLRDEAYVEYRLNVNEN